MSETFTQFVTLTKIECGECGGTYALSEKYRATKAQVGGSWHCPYCQVSWGYSLGENAHLRKQIEARERELREAKCETLRQQQLKEFEAGLRAKAEKKLRRVNNGVCPDCKRSFCNLARHMATKHSKIT